MKSFEQYKLRDNSFEYFVLAVVVVKYIPLQNRL